MFLAMIIANPLMIILGAVGAIATGYSDITFVLAAQGLLAPAFIVMILNIWSTAQGCVYSGSLSLGNTFKVDRRVLVIGFGLAGTIGAVITILEHLSTSLQQQFQHLVVCLLQIILLSIEKVIHHLRVMQFQL